MARWEPNARERLVHAALDLFAEQGYDATTVNEIADRAGLTKTTFFRHFPDKREVLFAGQDTHIRLLAEAVAAAPGPVTPLEAVRAALEALTATFTDDRREFSARLRPVIAGHSELQERAALKRVRLAEAMAGALQERGIPEPAASLAAELGIRAFHQAFDQWAADPAGRRTLGELTRRTLDELLAAMATLDQGVPDDVRVRSGRGA
ncbi:TetR/AcrR family transcriptional regulator [Streptomyces sp. Li-HN-5-11]|uniref:TetR/AcrR family transcriptional regulator n=1 Tax=Streptomyces sp. Li-HN-5-11 TaxID=3075432 RepID=UPI0028AF9438|nr:TetR/AcrR family transcriptional regulator [Streptomyces sp. Li-HN-5-11]WNM35964.1 TetR/AcrR family transcriptional regulator [Streptomyces sp. Li-HN-5-11]